MDGAQIMGLVGGALVGYFIGAAIAGGGYRHVGGVWFEVVKDPMGNVPGCLLEFVLTVLGGGVGYVLATALVGG